MPEDPTNPPPRSRPQPTSGPEPGMRRRRKLPPLWVWVVAAVCAVATVWVRRADAPDRQMANILTLIYAFIAFLGLVIWFLSFSGYSRRLRVSTGVGLIATIVLSCCALRIDHVSGTLVPRFQWRWVQSPDTLLESVENWSAGPIDLTTTSADDFPQFLGPNRNLIVKDVHLAHDWGRRPPKLLWRQPIGSGWSSFVVVGRYAVTMEQRGPQELVTCYDALTGEMQWSNAANTRHEEKAGGPGPRATPVVFEGKVITQGGTGILRCLDGTDGSVLWTHDLLTEFGVTRSRRNVQDGKAITWGRAGSPLIVGRNVVIPAGGPVDGPCVSLVAYDVDSGEEVWRGGDHQISYASPVLATICDVEQILSVNQGMVAGHDVKTGTELWEYRWQGKSNADATVSQPVAVGGDRVFLSKAYWIGSMVLRISRNAEGTFQAERIWAKKTVMKTKFTNVVIGEGHVWGLDDGVLKCIELDSGARKWRGSRFGQGQILRAGDVILVQAESGEVAMVEASTEKFVELGRFQAIEGKTWNNLCLSGNRLLVRNAEEAACYELPTAE